MFLTAWCTVAPLLLAAALRSLTGDVSPPRRLSMNCLACLEVMTPFLLTLVNACSCTPQLSMFPSISDADACLSSVPFPIMDREMTSFRLVAPSSILATRDHCWSSCVSSSLSLSSSDDVPSDLSPPDSLSGGLSWLSSSDSSSSVYLAEIFV